MAANIPDSTSQPQPAPPHRDAGYGVVEPTDGRGARFVAWACSEACAKALAAVARKHGHRPTDASRFIKQSESH
ncbi:hypothetical protein [Hymenobacter bucti]|uniref:Uncharacterized protein n=1 Tax=Hymenobacter bucti TaxID=1844114 RepID=A0ABW4QXK4_9BACT